jgi:hypothetical protein
MATPDDKFYDIGVSSDFGSTIPEMTILFLRTGTRHRHTVTMRKPLGYANPSALVVLAVSRESATAHQMPLLLNIVNHCGSGACNRAMDDDNKMKKLSSDDTPHPMAIHSMRN